MTTAPATADVFPPDVSTAPSAHYITGWNRVREAEFTYTTPTGYTPVDERSLVSTAPVSEIRVEPGEFLAIRWSNINDGGADALMGLDDLSLSFTAADVAISAAVGTVTRSRVQNRATVSPAFSERRSRCCHSASFRRSFRRAIASLLRLGMKKVNPRGYMARQDWLWWAHTALVASTRLGPFPCTRPYARCTVSDPQRRRFHPPLQYCCRRERNGSGNHNPCLSVLAADWHPQFRTHSYPVK
jgi:hypothetical protein